MLLASYQTRLSALNAQKDITAPRLVNQHPLVFVMQVITVPPEQIIPNQLLLYVQSEATAIWDLLK